MNRTSAIIFGALFTACGSPTEMIPNGFEYKSAAFRGAHAEDGHYTSGNLTLELSTLDGVCDDWKAARLRHDSKSLTLSLIAERVDVGTYAIESGDAFVTTRTIDSACNKTSTYDPASVQIDTFVPSAGGSARGSFDVGDLHVEFNAIFCELDFASIPIQSCE